MNVFVEWGFLEESDTTVRADVFRLVFSVPVGVLDVVFQIFLSLEA